MKALIFQNKVVDISDVEFPVCKEMYWVDCDENTKTGYDYVNNTIKKPEEPVLSYIQLRKNTYPPIEQQLDMIYHDKVNNTNLWLETIKKIKEDYPKE